MYVAFLLVAATGLMVTAQLAPVASFLGIAQKPLALVGWMIPALTFSLSLNNLMNGVGRPLFGWVSDLIGREFTLCLTFLAGGAAILCLGAYGTNPVGFVLVAAMIFLTWDIYSVFPALTSDHFGQKYASTNYAMLYTAKGTAALFVPIGSLLAIRTGSWSVTLVVAAIANVCAALIMIAVVRPLRLRELRRRVAQDYSGSDASAQIASP
jgi:OFA family oxalate/formate antiporter-like MFS transporter